jgi:hypothetical protein
MVLNYKSSFTKRQGNYPPDYSSLAEMKRVSVRSDVTAVHGHEDDRDLPGDERSPIHTS